MKKLLQIITVSLLFACSKQNDPLPIVDKSENKNNEINWFWYGDPKYLKYVYTKHDSLFIELNKPDILGNDRYKYLLMGDFILWFQFYDNSYSLTVTPKF
jgi:hypothetical protein